MKRILSVFGISALAVTLLSSVGFAQKNDEKKAPEKSRHIKIMKMVDGKKMELDTVITGNQLLVWQGDTINPSKHHGEFASSGFDKLHRFDVEVNDKDGKRNVMIYRHKGQKDGRPLIWEMDSDNEDQEFNLADGDSVGKKIIIRKRMRDRDGNEVFYFNGQDMKHFPPMPPVPPVPPVPHFKMLMHPDAGRVIDLNDPNIISYKKKDMSGGREKIEIIRKKSDKDKKMTFEFRDGDEPGSPEAIEMPGMDGDVHQMRITEKKTKVDDKDGKQVEVKVETEDNK